MSRIFPASEEKGITEEELLTIVEEAEQGGGIDKEESSLIRSAIEFNDLEAMDILTPRIDVEAIEKNLTEEEIAKIFRDTGYSRLPVYEENIDNIIGILYQKDFIILFIVQVRDFKIISNRCCISQRRKISVIC